MSKKASKQFSKAFETIEALKASNRKAFIKILAAMAAVLLLGLGRTALDVYGLIPSESVGTIASGAVYLIAIFMAFIAGQSGISIAKIDARSTASAIVRELRKIASRHTGRSAVRKELTSTNSKAPPLRKKGRRKP